MSTGAATKLEGALRMKNGIARRPKNNSSSMSKIATEKSAEIVPYIKLMKNSQQEDEHLGGAKRFEYARNSASANKLELSIEAPNHEEVDYQSRA
jgi:cell division septum initiation protein DivIVA